MTRSIDRYARIEAYFALGSGILSIIVGIIGVCKHLQYKYFRALARKVAYNSSTHTVTSFSDDTYQQQQRHKTKTDIYFQLQLAGVFPGVCLIIKAMILLIPSFRTHAGQVIIEFVGYASSCILFVLFGIVVYRVFIALQSTLGFQIPPYHRIIIYSLAIILILSVIVSEVLEIVLNRVWPDAIYFIVLTICSLDYCILIHVLMKYAQKTVSSKRATNSDGMEKRLNLIQKYMSYVTRVVMILIPALIIRAIIRLSDLNAPFYWNERIEGSPINPIFSLGVFCSCVILYGFCERRARTIEMARALSKKHLELTNTS